MDYRDIYKNWLASGALTADEKAELSAISDDLNAQKDRFGAELEFGTAGMRGVLGAGINRMNVYTVARATKGLARYIIGRGEDAMRRGVVVSYDTRRFSTEFAIVSAEVLNSFGIRVYLFENVRPVPVCSFAIRNLNAVAGIMITASHNPKIYNGYKVYGEDGAQMSPEDTAVVVKFIEEEKDYFAPYKKIGITESDIRNADGKTYENITVIGKSLDERYFAAIEKLMLSEDAVRAQRDKMKIVYTPIHGSGYMPVTTMLERMGMPVVTVPEQVNPDPDFSTVRVPNPEEADALSMAVALAKKVNAAVVIGTDPDCDRMGVAVRNDKGEFVKVAGDYRVCNVQVLDKKTGLYQPLDLKKTYTLGGIDYTITYCGDGFTMFKDSKVLKAGDATMTDAQTVLSYIETKLGGTIGEEYAKPAGRITIYSDVKATDWYLKAVKYALDAGLMNGVGSSFAPNGALK